MVLQSSSETLLLSGVKIDHLPIKVTKSSAAKQSPNESKERGFELGAKEINAPRRLLDLKGLFRRGAPN